MATIAFDAQNAVKDLKAAGANEDLARAVVRIIGESTAKDAIPRDKTFESAKLKLALGDLEVRITNRFAWISFGVLGVSIFSSIVLSISLLAS